MVLPSGLDTYENRWKALVFISLGLGIVIIDNTILNVSIPYMLRDLHTDLSSLELVISGYSLTIASALITVGRAGDLFGRRQIFRVGVAVFVVGSFIGSFSQHVNLLLFGRSLIQALGAAMTLSSALALIDSTFKGKERAVAFGVWGAIAGAAVTLGPLMGGYLTSYYSWRWSLRINVFVGILALAGTFYMMESRGLKEKKFDWPGTFLSSAGFFSLMYGVIEGNTYGWLSPKQQFSIFGYGWPLKNISIIPFFLVASLVLLVLFVLRERSLEKQDRAPLLEISIFRERGFSIGLIVLALLSFGLFGTFFMMPIFLENVLSLNALYSGIYFLPASLSLLSFGLASGFIAERVNIKWPIMFGTVILSIGVYFMTNVITVDATFFSLAPALIVFGTGFGLSSSQLNNLVLSSAPLNVAGEASAISTTMRQVGGSIGVAFLGVILASSLITNVTANVESDPLLPQQVKTEIIQAVKQSGIEAGRINIAYQDLPPNIADALRSDINDAIAKSTRQGLSYGMIFTIAAAIVSLFLYNYELDIEKMGKHENVAAG